jgi:hypothetical protein
MTISLETCQLCDRPAEVLQKWDETRMCRSCVTVLWFADVLLDSEATEAEIVPTLAFAPAAETLCDVRDRRQRAVEANRLLASYPAVKLTEMADGVPLLRMKEALAGAVSYPSSELTRSVQVRVLSRFARPAAVAALYEDVCESEGLPMHGSSAGSISWDCDNMHLKARVGPLEEIPRPAWTSSTDTRASAGSRSPCHRSWKRWFEPYSAADRTRTCCLGRSCRIWGVSRVWTRKRQSPPAYSGTCAANGSTRRPRCQGAKRRPD